MVQNQGRRQTSPKSDKQRILQKCLFSSAWTKPYRILCSVMKNLPWTMTKANSRCFRELRRRQRLHSKLFAWLCVVTMLNAPCNYFCLKQKSELMPYRLVMSRIFTAPQLHWLNSTLTPKGENERANQIIKLSAEFACHPCSRSNQWWLLPSSQCSTARRIQNRGEGEEKRCCKALDTDCYHCRHRCCRQLILKWRSSY